eukprot:gene29368-biopygen24324
MFEGAESLQQSSIDHLKGRGRMDLVTMKLVPLGRALTDHNIKDAVMLYFSNESDRMHIIHMSCMFYEAKKFNSDISGWDVSNVVTMAGMFYNASSFNQPIGEWDVGNVTNISSMFAEARSFNQPIGQWNPISHWDVSKVTSFVRMCQDAEAFNQPIDQWDFDLLDDDMWNVN